MSRAAVLCALLTSAVVSLAAGATPRATAASQEKAPPPLFPAGTELVTVDAVVLDRDGMPVVGLTAADFTVSEDGAAQEIAAFEAVHLPLEPAAAEAPPPPWPRRAPRRTWAARARAGAS